MGFSRSPTYIKPHLEKYRLKPGSNWLFLELEQSHSYSKRELGFAVRSFEELRKKEREAKSIARFAAMATTRVQRIMTQPINLIFRFLQSKARIQIWLFEQKDLRIEGRIIGFDEYMNLVLDDAEEVNIKKHTRKTLGRILLKGDNITLMQNTGK
ncbi:hypothetical protein AQUCO_01600114v1 [Aquilegia coerulea]|uniref:Small nuclear ribonucleoprotein E n=1 Tax=Aquilegia coerulea TaxID=218851 RepID=A0A2G5DQ58_AQUCA|nr:hypothetical protein AQUCO_01600114v1 [Aquilegia coerulea]